MEMARVCAVDGLGDALVFWKCSMFVQWKVSVMRWFYEKLSLHRERSHKTLVSWNCSVLVS